MASALAGGAVLGTVFSELYKGVQTLIRTTKHFKDLAKSIKLKLECLLPLIKQIEEQNMELGRSNQCTEKFKIEIVKGLELVRNCSKVGPLEISKKRNYIRELRKLDGSLKNWLDILMSDGVRDGKETLQSVRTMTKMMMAMFIVVLGVLVTTIIVIIKRKQKAL